MVQVFGNGVPTPVPHRSQRLRAQGNLTYLQFIRVMEYLWNNAHPDISFNASGLAIYPSYPTIVYTLIERQPQSGEVKARVRETIPTYEEESAILIKGQKFKNIVEFTVLSQEDPNIAEHLIEVFEDFMLEYIPLLKELGVSDIFYLRRIKDGWETRANLDITTRAIQYLVITEKVYRQDVDKMKSILLDVRKFFADDATPGQTVVYDATPVRVVLNDQYTALFDEWLLAHGWGHTGWGVGPWGYG